MSDPLRDEHENGDADGLGCFRGFGSAAVILGTLYLLVRYVILPYLLGE